MIQRLGNIGRTLLNHKKKAIFALVLTTYAATKVNRMIKDDQIRRHYALRAKQFGDEFIAPDHSLRKVVVLINREAGGRKAANLFNKNALPLLHLAGLQVDVLKVDSEAEIESISRVFDCNDADCLFIVGGDGTLCKVLNGIVENVSSNSSQGQARQQVPIGLFPGGRRNNSFFDALGYPRNIDSMVRLYCESAMALLEDNRRTLFPMKCTVKIEDVNKEGEQESTAADEQTEKEKGNSKERIFWTLSGVAAGMFENAEQRAPRLWWLGPLKERWCYFREVFLRFPGIGEKPEGVSRIANQRFIKTWPDQMKLKLSYQLFCPGCRRCSIDLPKQESGFLLSWMGWLFGRPQIQTDPKLIETSKRENPDCGIGHDKEMQGSDIMVDCDPTDCENVSLPHLRVATGGTNKDKMFYWQEALRRLNRGSLSREEYEQRGNFFWSNGTDIKAKRMTMQFLEVPAFWKKMTISGELLDFDDYANKRITVESGRLGIPFFVPKHSLTGKN